jgi:hypothetical protein
MTKEIVSNTSEGDWGQRLLQMQKSIEILRTELEERLRFSTLLAEISACFINFPTDQINNELDGASAASANFSTLIAPPSGKSLTETQGRVPGRHACNRIQRVPYVHLLR